MKKFLTVMVFALCLVAAGEVHAQSKIGYISSQELVSVMPATKKADSSLQELRSALVQNYTDKQNAFYAAVEKFGKDSATLSASVKTVKRNELTKMGQELSSEEERIQQQLQQKQQELLGPIQSTAYKAIQDVAKEGGYGYVFEKEALLVAPPGDDILPLVAKKLNIKLPAREGTAPAGTTPAPKTGTKP